MLLASKFAHKCFTQIFIGLITDTLGKLLPIIITDYEVFITK